jgi:head-tail adaptor
MTLTTAEITALRDHADNTFDQTCTINEPQLTSDAMGGHTIVWSSTHTNVACRLARAGKQERISIDGETITYHDLWRLHVAFDQAIEPGDRVEVGTDVFEVVGVDDAHQWSTIKSALLSFVEGAAAGQGAVTDVETGTALPASPSVGDMFVLTTTDTLYIAIDE